MFSRLKDITAAASIGKEKLRAALSLSFILPAAVSFALCLGASYTVIRRHAAVQLAKGEILRLQQVLNEVRLDLAYDKIEFSAWPFTPLFKVQNFQLYSLDADKGWNLSFPNVEASFGWMGQPNLKLNLGSAATLTAPRFKQEAKAEAAFLEIRFKDGKTDKVFAGIDNLELKNFAKIKEFTLAGRHLYQTASPQALVPFFENHVEVKNVAINGLVNYPLTSQINRLYLKTNFMGEFPADDSFRIALEEWLHRGGFIEIANLVVNWEPLSLVGRGELNFNENFVPAVRLQTSSKALGKLLEDGEKIGFLDKKGVFVAQILLSNKSFKLNSKDKYLTVLTPIDYRDNRLSVENITVKNFKRRNGQP